MKRSIEELVGQMTLEEKAGMCSGGDFWHLKGVERLDIPAVMVSDGPHGLRKQEQQGDHLGVNDSIEAVCFPAACATACSFDTGLLEALGRVLGAECRAQGVGVLLGPAINIKRSPLCGRNFEYFSEDPYLAGQLAAAQIKGIQSRGVGACPKHYAANNQEYHRLTCSAQIDPRTLREIYLAPFETAVKEARPWTVMCSYNKINGEQVSESRALLTGILREEWGFDGYVMSDWGAVNDRVKGLSAGLELEMPASGGSTDRQIAAAVREGRLPEAVLDRAVARILDVIFRYVDGKGEAEFDLQAHHELAVRMARECAVLLKNEGGVLPLGKKAKVAFIGEFARAPRFQGGGSSHINAFRADSAWEAARGRYDVQYAQGFCAGGGEPDEALAAEAVQLAAGCEAAVVFAGLPDSFECEGYDRSHMRLPECQNDLIRRIAAAQPNTVVALHGGSPVELPWADEVPAILELYLAGQGVGRAAAELLFGEANPCGKLAETFPLRVQDNPSYLNFPGNGNTVEYREGVFVGYRYYDKKQMPVRYPFGHGLSYTSFAYSGLRVDRASMRDDEPVTVRVDVTNTGCRAGKEIVQLYVADCTGAEVRPEKELKGFVKLELQPGQTKTAEFVLDRRSFAWYDPELGDWACSAGRYRVLVGASSRDIRQWAEIELICTRPRPYVVDANSRYDDLLAQPALRECMLRLLEKEYPPQPQAGSSAARAAITAEMQQRMDREAPLRSLRSFKGYTQEQLDELIERLNALLRQG